MITENESNALNGLVYDLRQLAQMISIYKLANQFYLTRKKKQTLSDLIERLNRAVSKMRVYQGITYNEGKQTDSEIKGVLKQLAILYDYIVNLDDSTDTEEIRKLAKRLIAEVGSYNELLEEPLIDSMV